MTNLPNDHELRIREARERSNQAIARHDLDAIAAQWMDDVSVLGSSGAHATGREANRQMLGAQFLRRPDTVYCRTPDKITVLPAWAVAAESGRWEGRWTEPDGPLRIGGSYHAQWRLIEGRWLIQGELFVPDYCEGGAYCLRHP